MNFIVNNQETKKNSFVHSINTMNKHDLHRPNANLSCLQKNMFYAGIRILNSLPYSLTSLKNEKAKFKLALRYLNTHSFYSVDKFLCVKMIHNTVCKMFIIFCPVIILYTLYILCVLWLSPHPTVILKNLWIRGACMYVCMLVYIVMFQHRRKKSVLIS
jgi:hypothetical protein